MLTRSGNKIFTMNKRDEKGKERERETENEKKQSKEKLIKYGMFVCVCVFVARIFLVHFTAMQSAWKVHTH